MRNPGDFKIIEKIAIIMPEVNMIKEKKWLSMVLGIIFIFLFFSHSLLGTYSIVAYDKENGQIGVAGVGQSQTVDASPPACHPLW